MTHGSLFSGIGGFDLAAEWMGWHNAFHCEIDSFCSTVLKYHFPDARHYSDIRDTDFTEWRGRVDILTGGFPCQPFSVAGRRRGADDDRYLWPEMLRVIREIRPAWVIGENVAGILTMVQPGEEAEVAIKSSLFGEGDIEIKVRERYIVETVCSDLEREGYSVQPLVIPACAVGAPHRRDRVWFVAHRADAGAETVQYGREEGIHADGTSSDTDSLRQRGRTCQQEHVSQCAGASDNSPCGEDGTPAHSQCRGGMEVHDEVQPGQPDGKGVYGDGRERNAAHTGSSLSECRMSASEERRDTEDRPTEPPRCIPDWSRFPTQSPVCGGDDGLSARLDGISFPRWRSESVKAYGNAVVPQVVYEIFRAIEMAEKSFRQ